MIFKKNIKITVYWIDLCQIRLNYQIQDPSHKTLITPHKKIKQIIKLNSQLT